MKRMDMESNKYEMHSGGAVGADTYWDVIGRKFGVKKFHHYYYKKKNHLSSDIDLISTDDYDEGIVKVNLANETLNRKGHEKYMHLLARNWLQIKNSDCLYAIGIMNGNRVHGGTGWAVQMAIDNITQVNVFDQSQSMWYIYNFKSNKFEKSSVPILTKQYGGVGTRNLNHNGERAIREVYIKTFHNTGLF
jgi:hypothetical protein